MTGWQNGHATWPCKLVDVGSIPTPVSLLGGSFRGAAQAFLAQAFVSVRRFHPTPAVALPLLWSIQRYALDVVCHIRGRLATYFYGI